MSAALQGMRVLVTRPKRQSTELAQKLAELGAQPVFFPAIEIAPLEDFSRLDAALRSLASYDWVVFTSANGVEAVWNRLAALRGLACDWKQVRVAAIGPATAQALHQRGVEVGFMPARYVAEAIAEGLGDVKGQRFLLLRAEIAREALAEELHRRGATVENVAVYRTIEGEPEPSAWQELERGVDVVTLTSSSTARRFAQVAAEKRFPWLAECLVACIGPITADTARECGLNVGVIAEEFTAAGLAKALAAYAEQKSLNGMKRGT